MKKLLTLALILGILTASIPVNAAVTAENAPEWTVSYFADAEHTEPVEDITKIPSDTAVYYAVDVAEGYRVYRITVTADYADSEKIIFGDVSDHSFEATVAPVGDFDTDGDIDLMDATYILKYTAKQDTLVAKQIASLDFDGDGRVSLIDCAKVMKYAAHWDGVEPSCGVMENVPVYCEKEIPVTGDTFIQNFGKPTGYQLLLTVVKDEADLEGYFTDVGREHFDTDNGDSVYNEQSIKAKYNEEFFAGYDLAIIDAENVWWLPTDITFTHLEVADGTLTVVISTSPGALHSGKGDVVHYLVPIPKGFDRVAVISRTSTDVKWNELIEYEETSLLSTDERPYN